MPISDLNMQNQLLFQDCRRCIHRALQVGVITSFIFVIIFMIPGILLYTKKSQKIILLGKSLEMTESISYLFLSTWRKMWSLYCTYVLCLVLLTIWWATLTACFFKVYELAMRLIIKKIGLSTREDSSIKYFKEHTINLRSHLFRMGIICFLIVAPIILLVAYRTNGDLRQLTMVGFFSTLLFSVIVFLYSYVYDWLIIKRKYPNMIEKVYGRATSLGHFFYVLACIIFIVFIFRCSLPILIAAGDFVSEEIFGQIAQNILYSHSYNQVYSHISSIDAAKVVSDTFPNIKKFSVKWVMSEFIKETKLDPFQFKKQLFRYVYWISILAATLSLLIPMVLYNLTLPRKINTLMKVIKISCVSLIVGIGLPWLQSWLFLTPSPSIEITSFTSMLVFTIYVNWIYTK